MAEKKQTIFQRILNVIDPTPKNYIDPVYGDDYIDDDLVNRMSDYEKSNLEREQMKLLSKQYSSIAKGRYDRNSLYGYNRQLVYLEFEQMEFYPAIARALDIYSEESCTTNSEGRILGIQAKEKRVKEELERLFYQVMAINTNLFFWTRELVKFGEVFLSRNVELNKGITNIEQVPGLDVQIEFKEDEQGIKKKVYDLTGSQFASEMSPLTIGHIKLLGDGRYAPYGVSMIDKARKIYQQLRLAEDAMLVYRVTRAPERRVYKIDVGNLNPQEADEHIANIRKDMKSDSIVGRDGTVDLRAKYLRTDEDIFIPVRNGTQTTVVDTLPGASNLGDIHDIEYLRDNLFTALGIPKAYLGYEEPAGQGKNLAQEDIRLARTVNRIQQSIINGLNEMAIIHLMALGYENITPNDFKLTLTNPSTQGDILKLELINQQLDVYEKAVSTPESGIAPYSITSAKKRILGMSDAEIMQDLKQQRVEKAVSGEIQKTAEVINSTGIFSSIDAKFDSYQGDAPTGTTQNTAAVGALPALPAAESFVNTLEDYVKLLSEDAYEEYEKFKRKSKIYEYSQDEKDILLKEEKFKEREKNIEKSENLLKKISKTLL